MKYTLNYILWKEKNAKEQYPIYLRITINRKRSYIATGYSVLKNQWDEKAELVKPSHPLSVEMNADLTTRKSNIIKRVVALQMDGKQINATELKKFATAKGASTNIFSFVKSLKTELVDKRAGGTFRNYQKCLNKLEQYHGSKDLSIDEIDASYLSSFEKHLRDAGYKNNYVQSIFNVIRMFFNAARKRGITNNYPFNVYEMPVYRAPEKDHFTLEELEIIENYINETDNIAEKKAIVYLLLGCYSGLRLSDWKQFDINKHIKNEFILLRAKKNGSWVSMELNRPLKRNIERMKLLPLDITGEAVNRILKRVMRKLKIRKTVTTHTGRHTFAVTICAEGKVGCETCAELMGINIKTCVENYYRVTQPKINDETRVAWERLK